MRIWDDALFSTFCMMTKKTKIKDKKSWNFNSLLLLNIQLHDGWFHLYRNDIHANSLIVAGMSAGFAHQYVGPKRVLNLPLAMTLSAESTGEQASLYFHHDSFVVGLPWVLLQVPWFYSWFISPNTRQMHRDPANRPALGCGLTQARAWSSGPWTDMIDSVALL